MKLTRWRFLLVVAMLTVGVASAADDNHGWAVVYTARVVNPNISTAMMCYPARPDCNTVYMDEERTEWFPTKEMAVNRLNGRSYVSSRTILYNGNTSIPVEITPENLIGIYESRRVEVRRVKVGSQKVTVQEPKEVEQDVMEWKP